MRILSAKQHRRMPWKNGGGETTEIIASPEGAGLDAFDWRISMARVGADGPFSLFPAIDRTLSVLDGDGIALTIAGRRDITLTPASEPLSFPADVATSARLLNGGITDLNVMTRRGSWRHGVRRLVIDARLALRCNADVTLVLSRSQALVLAAGSKRAMLGVDDAAIFDGPADLTLELVGTATLFVAELRRV
jgi:environmental stress-induced protein Ves